MSIQANLKEVLSELPTGVRLVAVSKKRMLPASVFSVRATCRK